MSMFLETTTTTPTPMIFKNKFDDTIESTRTFFPRKEDVPFRSYPKCFEENYVLPSHREKNLSIANKIPFFDDNIHFHEEPHLYVCFGRIATASASEIAKPYKDEFDERKIIPSMMRSKHFPKLRYAVNPKEVTNEELFLLPNDTIIILHNVETNQHVFTGPKISCPPLCDANERAYTFDRPFTYEEISASWKSSEARNKGTEGHLQMENFFNGESVWLCDEIEAGLAFAKSVMAPNKIQGFRCEFEVYAPEEDVAGSVDFLAKTKDENIFHIFDWKRAKPEKLKEIFPKCYKKMLKAPFNHIVQSDVGVYTFQISIYKYIIEKYTDMKIDTLALVSIFPGFHWHTFCPFFDLEVEYLMRLRRETVAARITAQILNPDLPVCERSGIIAFDAVQTEDGRIFNKRYHKLDTSLPPATDFPEAKNRVRTVIANVFPARTSKEEADLFAKRRPFEERMPKEGIQSYKKCDEF